jgi:hypothetical protein
MAVTELVIRSTAEWDHFPGKLIPLQSGRALVVNDYEGTSPYVSSALLVDLDGDQLTTVESPSLPSGGNAQAPSWQPIGGSGDTDYVLNIVRATGGGKVVVRLWAATPSGVTLADSVTTASTGTGLPVTLPGSRVGWRNNGFGNQPHYVAARTGASLTVSQVFPTRAPGSIDSQPVFLENNTVGYSNNDFNPPQPVLHDAQYGWANGAYGGGSLSLVDKNTYVVRNAIEEGISPTYDNGVDVYRFGRHPSPNHAFESSETDFTRMRHDGATSDLLTSVYYDSEDAGGQRIVRWGQDGTAEFMFEVKHIVNTTWRPIYYQQFYLPLVDTNRILFWPVCTRPTATVPSAFQLLWTDQQCAPQLPPGFRSGTVPPGVSADAVTPAIFDVHAGATGTNTPSTVAAPFGDGILYVGADQANYPIIDTRLFYITPPPPPEPPISGEWVREDRRFSRT